MDISSSPGDGPPPALSASSSSSSNHLPQTPGSGDRLPTVKDLLTPRENSWDKAAVDGGDRFKLSPMRETLLQQINNNAPPSIYHTSASTSLQHFTGVDLSLHYHHNAAQGSLYHHSSAVDSSPSTGTGAYLVSSPVSAFTNDNGTSPQNTSHSQQGQHQHQMDQRTEERVAGQDGRSLASGFEERSGSVHLEDRRGSQVSSRKRGRSVDGLQPEGDRGMGGVGMGRKTVSSFGPTIVVADATSSFSAEDINNERLSSSSEMDSSTSSKKKRAGPPAGLSEAISQVVQSGLSLQLPFRDSDAHSDCSSSHSSVTPGGVQLSRADNDSQSSSSSWNHQLPLDGLPTEFEGALRLQQSNPTPSETPLLHVVNGQAQGRGCHEAPLVEHQQSHPLPSRPDSVQSTSTDQRRSSQEIHRLDEQASFARTGDDQQAEARGEEVTEQRERVQPSQTTPRQSQSPSGNLPSSPAPAYEAVPGHGGGPEGQVQQQIQQTPLNFTYPHHQQLFHQYPPQIYDPAAAASSSTAQPQAAYDDLHSVFSQSGPLHGLGQFQQQGNAPGMSTASSSTSFASYGQSISSSAASAFGAPASFNYGRYPVSPSPLFNNQGNQQQSLYDGAGGDFRARLLSAGGRTSFERQSQQEAGGSMFGEGFNFGDHGHPHQQQQQGSQMEVDPLDANEDGGSAPTSSSWDRQLLLPQQTPVRNQSFPGPSLGRSASFSGPSNLSQLDSPPSDSSISKLNVVSSSTVDSKPINRSVKAVRGDEKPVRRRYSLPNKPGTEELTLLCPNTSPPPNYRPKFGSTVGTRNCKPEEVYKILEGETRPLVKMPNGKLGVAVGRFGDYELKKPKFKHIFDAKKEEEAIMGIPAVKVEGQEEEEAEKTMKNFMLTGGNGMPRVYCEFTGCRRSFKHRGLALTNHVRSHYGYDPLYNAESESSSRKSSVSRAGGGGGGSARKGGGAAKKRRSSNKYTDDEDEDDFDDGGGTDEGDSDAEWKAPSGGKRRK